MKPHPTPTQKKYNRGGEEYHHRRERNQWEIQNKISRCNNRVTGIGVFFSAAATIAAVAAACYAANAYFQTRKEATAAETQVRIMGDQEQRQLRPYVGIVGSSITINCTECSEPNPPNTPTMYGDFNNAILYEVKNYGLTPAEKPWMCGDMKAVPFGQSISADYANSVFASCDAPGAVPAFQPTIWPGEQRQWVARIKSPLDIALARANTESVFFFGRIRYHDQFGYIRNTYFCFLYLLDSQGKEGFFGCSGKSQPDDN